VGKRYNPVHSVLLSRRLAQHIGARLSAAPYDVIFAPAGSTEIAHLKTDIPIVYLSDTTFNLIHNYYSAFSNLLSLSVWEGHRIEGLAIKKARKIIYSSEWAARSAVADYKADFRKIQVIPFGANIEVAEVPDRDIVRRHRSDTTCTLLFLGGDWDRKGGPIAFETLLELERLGLNPQLLICGCTPPDHFRHPRMRIIPFLDKSDPAQRARFHDLFAQSHFMLAPTRADCTPIAFSEASAYALPIAATNTGGVPDIVHDGENGFLLPLDATGLQYAQRIAAVWSHPDRYRALSVQSRAAFESRLNWDAWGRSVRELLTPLTTPLRAGVS
jgi:glycosyltransferase involved in cell wall biosynthesis